MNAKEVYKDYVDGQNEYEVPNQSSLLRLFKGVRETFSTTRFQWYAGSHTKLHKEKKAITRKFDIYATKYLISICGSQNVKVHHINRLLSDFADPNSTDVKSNDYPLHKLIRMNGDIKCVKLLLEDGAMIDAVNNRGETPLIVACNTRSFNSNQLQTVRLLLKSSFMPGKYVNLFDKYGNSAGILATKYSNILVLRELLIHGLRVSKKLRSTLDDDNEEIDDYQSIVDVSKEIYFRALVRSKISSNLLLEGDNVNLSLELSSNNESFMQKIFGGSTSISDHKFSYSPLDNILGNTTCDYESSTLIKLLALKMSSQELCYRMILHRENIEKREFHNEKLRIHRLNNSTQSEVIEQLSNSNLIADKISNAQQPSIHNTNTSVILSNNKEKKLYKRKQQKKKSCHDNSYCMVNDTLTTDQIKLLVLPEKLLYNASNEVISASNEVITIHDDTVESIIEDLQKSIDKNKTVNDYEDNGYDMNKVNTNKRIGSVNNNEIYSNDFKRSPNSDVSIVSPLLKTTDIAHNNTDISIFTDGHSNTMNVSLRLNSLTNIDDTVWRVAKPITSFKSTNTFSNKEININRNELNDNILFYDSNEVKPMLQTNESINR